MVLAVGAGGLVLGLVLGAVGVGAIGTDDDPPTTELVVRVVAAGAKYVSPELGGVDVWVADADSGEVVATGQVEGDSGDTEALMSEPRTRSQPLPTTATSAKAVLDVPLSEARRVVVHASGPRLGDGAVATTSASVWMVPGVRPGGDEGVVLELRGLAVSFLEPTPHQTITADGPVAVPVRAAVEMLCGCPIGPDTPWKPDEYEVTARALRDGEEVDAQALSFAGVESRFHGELELPGPGVYELQVVAEQASVANVGVARNGMVVEAPGSS